MTLKLLKDCNLKNRVVLVRSDLNVPLDKNSNVVSPYRIKRSLETIKYILNNGGKPIILTHLGRPMEDDDNLNNKLSTICLKKIIEDELNLEVNFCNDYLLNPLNASSGVVNLLENARFNKGEKANSIELAKKYRKLSDIFVMDAFAVSHRNESSVVAISSCFENKYVGLLFEEELSYLNKALNTLDSENKILTLGGSKLSTKLPIIENLKDKVSRFIFGGGILNTFLVAQGYEVGTSCFEPEWAEKAQEILSEIKFQKVVDLVVLNSKNKSVIKNLDDISCSDCILDLGPETLKNIYHDLSNASYVIWNGPLGKIEEEEFSTGTKTFIEMFRDFKGFSIAGGGETIEAIERFGGEKYFSYLSTGGGAFLSYLAKGTTLATRALMYT